jgi:hypothetical protein
MFGWLKDKTPDSINQILKNTPKGYRQRSTDIRSNLVKQEWVLKELSLWQKIKSFFTKDKVKVLFVKLHFEVMNITNNNKYEVAISIPYTKGMTYKDILSNPAKMRCGCSSFKFRNVWVMEQKNNLLSDEKYRKFWGVAMTEAPRIRNAEEINYSCKHLYHVLTDLVDGKYQIEL